MFKWKELAYAINRRRKKSNYGALLARLQNMRHTGDYDDFLDWTQEDVEPCFPKVEAYIEKIKSIIYNMATEC